MDSDFKTILNAIVSQRDKNESFLFRQIDKLVQWCCGNQSEIKELKDDLIALNDAHDEALQEIASLKRRISRSVLIQLGDKPIKGNLNPAPGHTMQINDLRGQTIVFDSDEIWIGIGKPYVLKPGGFSDTSGASGGGGGGCNAFD